MPRIKNLTNITGTVVYPKTSSDAVDVNGTILTDILNNKADKSYVTDEIAKASFGGEVDLSDLATKDELALKADTSSIPTKTSQLTNDSGFIESIPSDYVTEAELNAKEYLTSQDISMKADKSDLHTHDNKTVLDSITSNKVTEWDNKSNFDGNYNSLNDKPTIPTVDVDKNYVDTQLATKANKSEIPSLKGYATETFVTNKIADASLSGKEVDLSGLATKDELAKKADTSSIPTKTSELTNDSGFITSVPSEYITETELNAKGYLTEHQDISMKADKTELHSHSNKTVLDGITSTKVTEWNNKSTFDGNYNSLTNKPKIPTVDVDKDYVDTQLANKSDKTHNHDTVYALKTDIPTVPTKTSELTNDSGFIKSIPSEYVTETELTAKGYLTKHQDISGKVDKVEGKGLSTNDLTNDLKSKYDTAYTHSKSPHFSGSYNDLTGIPTIPTSLPADGGNANTVGGISLAIKTSKEYADLQSKSDKTLYIISDGGKIYLGNTLIAEVNPTQAE